MRPHRAARRPWRRLLRCSSAGVERLVVASYVLHHAVSPGYDLLHDRLDISIEKRAKDATVACTEPVELRIVDEHPREGGGSIWVGDRPQPLHLSDHER